MIMTAGEFNSQFGKNVHEVFANTSKLYEEGKTYFNKIAFTEDVKERTLINRIKRHFKRYSISSGKR